MDENIAVIRMLERILVVLFGGLSIYLGYRLFFHLPLERRSGGELNFPGIKIVLTKVGPGVFFAAFGAIVLYTSLSHTIAMTTKSDVAGAGMTEGSALANSSDMDNKGPLVAKKSETFEFVGAGPRMQASSVKKDFNKMLLSSVTPQQRARATSSLQMLNCLSQLVPDIENLGSMSDQAVLAIRDAKIALLQSVWDEQQWGDIRQLSATGLEPDASPELQTLFDTVHGGCPS